MGSGHGDGADGRLDLGEQGLIWPDPIRRSEPQPPLPRRRADVDDHGVIAVEFLANVAQALNGVGRRSACVDLNAHDANHRYGVKRHHLERHEFGLAATTLIDAALDDHDLVLLEVHARGDEGL